MNYSLQGWENEEDFLFIFLLFVLKQKVTIRRGGQDWISSLKNGYFFSENLQIDSRWSSNHFARFRAGF